MNKKEEWHHANKDVSLEASMNQVVSCVDSWLVDETRVAPLDVEIFRPSIKTLVIRSIGWYISIVRQNMEDIGSKGGHDNELTTKGI